MKLMITSMKIVPITIFLAESFSGTVSTYCSTGGVFIGASMKKPSETRLMSRSVVRKKSDYRNSIRNIEKSNCSGGDTSSGSLKSNFSRSSLPVCKVAVHVKFN